MSDIGFYRYKKIPTAEGTSTIVFNVGGTPTVTHTIVTKKRCDNDQLVRYLDKNGQYRFYPFNRFWEKKDQPTEIGRTSELIISLLNSQTDSKSVGYRNKRIISLVAESVTSAELDILADLWTSPRVYLYIGDGTTDGLSDWVLCRIVGGDNIVRRRKGEAGKIAIDLELPQNYCMTNT